MFLGGHTWGSYKSIIRRFEREEKKMEPTAIEEKRRRVSRPAGNRIDDIGEPIGSPNITSMFAKKDK